MWKQAITMVVVVILAFALIVGATDAIGAFFGSSVKLVAEILIALILLGLLILNFRKGK